MTNLVLLSGRLSRPVTERALPSGARLAVLDLTIPGAEGERAESVPLAWFEAPDWLVDAEPGTELVVLGRVRRRFFQAGTGLQSRTEVVVSAGTIGRKMSSVASISRKAVAVAAAVPGEVRSR